MAKKILITGSAGFVGKNLCRVLDGRYEVFGVDKKEGDCVDRVVDIADRQKITDVLDYFRPDVIIHSAAYSNVDGCEISRDLAYNNNVFPLEILVGWSKSNDARLVFLSSDYVYDGIKGAFTEEDGENPLQYYGQNKLDGEKMIISNLEKYVILRPTVIYGWDPDGMNFFMQLYRNYSSNKKTVIPTDQISNPTYISDLCGLIKKILEKPEGKGVYVATGRESIGRYDFARKIFKHMGWVEDILVPKKTEELGQVAKRPLNNSSDSSKVCREFDFQFKDINCNLDLIKDQL